MRMGKRGRPDTYMCTSWFKVATSRQYGCRSIMGSFEMNMVRMLSSLTCMLLFILTCFILKSPSAGDTALKQIGCLKYRMLRCLGEEHPCEFNDETLNTNNNVTYINIV